MLLTKKSYKFICLLCIFINPRQLIADQCPTPEIIKDRKISRDYEWTIDERRSLDDVLAVENLYSVRIKNKDEFIACFYSGSKNLLRLDGKPVKEGCVVNKKSGSWELVENGEKVCKETDLGLCVYDIYCGKSSRLSE